MLILDAANRSRQAAPLASITSHRVQQTARAGSRAIQAPRSTRVGYLSVAPMNAEIIAVGSELLTPFRLDTNSLFLTEELNRVGVRVIHKAVVGDSPEEIRSSFSHALSRADLIVSSGGLGPTDDDRTRDTVADLLGRKLRIDEDIVRHIQERFRRFGRAMPE